MSCDASSAAAVVSGAANVSLRALTLDHAGGNGIAVLDYAREVSVIGCILRLVAEVAIVVQGVTDGIDGTRGEQPRGTTFAGNLVRDLGINERQSSAFGEFKACLSTVERNVIFNIPRAAVNINDGFGGGTRIARNLLFNTCRESGDHGGPIALRHVIA